MGRHFVEDQMVARGAHEFVDDAGLVAGELLANARQHGLAPVTVCVSGDADVVRVEVRDGSSRTPVRAAHSLSNMTGRGLTLVDAFVSRWGVERGPGRGKTVWVEFAGDSATKLGQEQRDALLVEWADDAVQSTEELFTVVLGDVPTDLLIEAKSHMDNLVREFLLASAAGSPGEDEAPEHYARLIDTVVHGFSDARHAIKRQALAAAGRGDR
ncbi:MAG: ATP-binding protein, partial [Actinomycetes bacterium]